MKNSIYCNHDDTFVAIPNPLRDEFVEFSKTKTFRAITEALGYIMMIILGRKYKHY